MIQEIAIQGAMMLTEEKKAAPPSEVQGPGLPEPGEVLDGRFRVLELLSEGGTSRIYKATDLERGDLVALKVPKDHFARDQEFLKRFQREEEIGLHVRHPWLVPMRPVFGKTRPYLAMEYVMGETLAHRLSTGPRLSASEAAHIAAMVLEALEELHRKGIVHRDITPQNVILCGDGTVRLMDYGIASIRNVQAAEEWIWGTPAYMAPEQVRNAPGDARTDLYAVGVVLYEMLTGSVPFVGEDLTLVMNARLEESPVAPRTLNPSLDPRLERLVLRALSKEPGGRYPSAGAMRRALEPFASGRTEPVAQGTMRSGWQAWTGEHWTEVALAILLVTLLARIILGARSLSG